MIDEAPYERTPAYVKEGSIIPFGPELQYTSEKPADTITLFVYTGKDAAFTLYEDENTNYNYEKGAFTNIPFTYNEATKQLSIGERQGKFPGMFTNRTFKIVWISKTRAKELNFNQKEDEVVKYSANRIVVRMK
jgi:alpha-D-xyloside xylohydrolase